MSPELHLAVFLCSVVLLQGIATLWCQRVSGSAPTTLLVALLPFVGLPYLLWQLRSRLQDNHIAGAITYLALLAAAFGFYFAKPPDETPWMVIHTMEIFGLFGVGNVVGTPLKA